MASACVLDFRSSESPSNEVKAEAMLAAGGPSAIHEGPVAAAPRGFEARGEAKGQAAWCKYARGGGKNNNEKPRAYFFWSSEVIFGTFFLQHPVSSNRRTKNPKPHPLSTCATN